MKPVRPQDNPEQHGYLAALFEPQPCMLYPPEIGHLKQKCLEWETGFTRGLTERKRRDETFKPVAP